MNSIGNVTVYLELADRDDTDYLVADLKECGISEKFEIDLNDKDACQPGLKNLCLEIAKAMCENDVAISYADPENYPRRFIADAMSAYVKDLQTEMKSVGASLRKDLEVPN